MSQQMAVFLARRSLTVALMMVGPILGAGLAVGLVMALFQAVTQIREMTLAIIPKILAVGATLFVLLPWMLQVMTSYTSNMLQWAQTYGG